VKRSWVNIAAGVAILLVFVGIGAVVVSVAWFREHLEVSDTTEPDAARAFDEIHAKFPGKKPLLEWRDGAPSYVEDRATDSGWSGQLTTLHVLAFSSDNEKLTRLEVPFWLLRMKSGTFRFGNYASGLDDGGVNLRPEEIDRHGPGIVLDFTRDNKGRVLVWAE
jgi:hypothetical protein